MLSSVVGAQSHRRTIKISVVTPGVGAQWVLIGGRVDRITLWSYLAILEKPA